MIKILIKKIVKLKNINFRFDLPKKKNILQYDELNSNILKKSIKKILMFLKCVKKRKSIFGFC